jgi:hypothetical protein
MLAVGGKLQKVQIELPEVNALLLAKAGCVLGSVAVIQ